MPSSCHPLVHVLLLWLSILSIVQVAFITLYLTSGHHSVQSQNYSVTASEPMKRQETEKPWTSTEHELSLGKGKMLSFQAYNTGDSKVKKIKWVTRSMNTTPITVKEDLVINKDGYYFLNLQLTLPSCSQIHRVRLLRNKKILLQGQTNTESCSTGLLGKVEVLPAGQKLEVTVDPAARINTTESVTHLDIIYILKP